MAKNILWKSILVLIFLFKFCQPVFLQTVVKPGTVGFKTTKKTTKDGKPELISIWYPATGNGEKITLRNYIIAGKLETAEPDSNLFNAFISIFKRIFPSL